MCFTVNVNLVKEELENRYGSTFLDPEKYRPSYYYHAFSLPLMPAICSGKTDKIQLLRWGFIPSWVKNAESASEIRFKTFNARAESIESKALFAGAFKAGRCLIPVKGFYEWQQVGKRKIPWYIYKSDNDIISLAGLWSEWIENTTGELINSFSIITTDANEMMASIHNTKKRMPVILDRSSEKKWIDLSTSPSDAHKLLKPCPPGILKAHTISPLINDRTSDRNTPEITREYLWNEKNTLF